MKKSVFVRSAALMAATTVGAGMFALPYTVFTAGWLTAFFYVAALGGFVTFGHILYGEVLLKTHSEKSLLGLVRAGFGRVAGAVASIAIVGGLMLALVIYLILAGSLVDFVSPGFAPLGMFVFWACASLPLILRLRRVVASELIGGLLLLAIIVFIFIVSLGKGIYHAIPVATLGNVLFPFGIVLFSFAGWTAVEPIMKYSRQAGVNGTNASRAMIAGWVAAAVMYALFVFGVLGLAREITPDTVSGLSGLGVGLSSLIGVAGLAALWTSYVPVSLEIKNSLERDRGWKAGSAIIAVILAPVILLAAGLSDFLESINLAGGLFLGAQYVFIAMVAKKILRPVSFRRMALNVLVILFVVAAVYEAYTFVLH